VSEYAIRTHLADAAAWLELIAVRQREIDRGEL
jgi:hypothetical protein